MSSPSFNPWDMSWWISNISANPEAGFCGSYLDREGGVTLEDCAEVSGEVGAVLEAQDVIPQAYVLEVSSPGLTRPLKKPEDFQKFRNHLVKIKMYQPLDGRKNFKGTLLGLEGENVRLEIEDRVYELPLQKIAKANLEIEF